MNILITGQSVKEATAVNRSASKETASSYFRFFAVSSVVRIAPDCESNIFRKFSVRDFFIYKKDNRNYNIRNFKLNF